LPSAARPNIVSISCSNARAGRTSQVKRRAWPSPAFQNLWAVRGSTVTPSPGPSSGEVLVFHKTSRDTGGEYVLVETILRPGATVAAAHSHPYQSETFSVLEGRVGFKVDGKRVGATPPASVSGGLEGRRFARVFGVR
jgi:mannose-6-phosphate isomerase-like protein (cupin superfamily)